MINKATLNPVLTGLAQQFMADQTGFVASVIAPTFNTGMPSGQYYLFDRENFLNLPKDLNRAPNTAYQSLHVSLSDDTFICRDLGVKAGVDDTERALYASSFSADQAATNRATLTVMIEHEAKVQAMLADASIPTAAATASFATATIIQIKADFRTATESIRLNSGIKPNVCVMSETVKNALLDNPAVVSQIAPTVMTGTPTEAILSQILNIPPISVASAIVNADDEGEGLTPNDLWEDDVYLAVTNGAQDLQAVNFARTFAWTAPGVGGSLSIKSFRDDEKNTDWFVSHAFRGQKLTAPKAGYKITAALP